MDDDADVGVGVGATGVAGIGLQSKKTNKSCLIGSASDGLAK